MVLPHQEFQKKLKAYETFQEKIKSRSSNLWVLASVFISISWLIFAQGIVSAESIGLFKLSLIAIASISSCVLLSVYTCHTHRNNKMDQEGLENIEVELNMNVFGNQANKIRESKITKVAHNAIYILTGIICATWFVFIFDNLLNPPIVSTITLSTSYILTSLLNPQILFVWSVTQNLFNKQPDFPILILVYIAMPIAIIVVISGFFGYCEKIKKEGIKPTIYMFKGDNDKKVLIFDSGENVYCYCYPWDMNRDVLDHQKKNKRPEIWIKSDC